MLVYVSAPKGTRRTRIAGLVKKKAEWVINQQERLRSLVAVYPREFISGESVLYIGSQYRLRINKIRRAGTFPKVGLYAGVMKVTIGLCSSDSEQRDIIRNALVVWYSKRANDYLPRLAERYSHMLGISYKTLSIVDFRKRWGSGGPNGKLRFNWRIMMARRPLIAYVVAHEVCHILHPHHSNAFWRALQKLVPNYKELRTQLEHLGPRYDF
jgi:predicted metal-dependent hydrolase